LLIVGGEPRVANGAALTVVFSLSLLHNDQVLSGQTEVAEGELPDRSVPTGRPLNLGARGRRSGLPAEAVDHDLVRNRLGFCCCFCCFVPSEALMFSCGRI